jgi:hypothetical protein
MDNYRLRLQSLDESTEPCAILYHGIFVYANEAFVLKLGYNSFSEIKAKRIRDLPLAIDPDDLATFLKRANLTVEVASSRPKCKISVTGGKDVVLSGYSTYFGGSRVTCLTASDSKQIRVPRIFQRLADSTWKPLLAIAFVLLLTVASGLLLTNININNAPKVYLPSDSPAVVIDEKLREVFPNDEGLVLLFEGVALYSDGFMDAMDRLTNVLESHEAVDTVISVTSQDHIRGTESGFIIEPLIDVDNEDRNAAQRRERILGDRFANGLLAAPDGSALALVVIPETMQSSLARMALQDEITDLVADHGLKGYLTAVAGQITTDVEQTRSLIDENKLFIPTTVIVGLLLIWFLFRRVLALAVTGLVLASVVNTTISLHVVFNQPFNMISSILPPLLSALSIAALVHLFNAISYASKRGKMGAERVADALAEVKRPALYTALTTMAGFASLAFSPITPIRVFGLITAAGVGFIYLVVYHLVPPILARYDHNEWRTGTGRRSPIDRIVGLCYRFGARRPVPTLVVTASLLVIGSPFIANVVVETNLLQFFASDHKTRIATEHIEEKIAGTGSLDISFTSARSEGLISPSNLNVIRDFQDWAEQQPEVDKALSPVDFIEEMHWGFHAEQSEYRTIPDNPDLISQYLFIYDGDDLYDFLDESYRQARVSLNINVHGANEISMLMDRIRDYLASRDMDDMEWQIAGLSRMFAEQEDLLVKGQIYSMVSAVGMIFLFMLVLWRSLKDSLICMIPNLSPILIIFIAMGIFGIWLDMATAMIASVAVGIAIDDTIHVYHGFISRVRKGGVRPVTAIARTYRQAGRAITTTTIILCAQFMLLTTSAFAPINSFGLLTSAGLLAALLFDILLLPALLVLLFRPATPASGDLQPG